MCPPQVVMLVALHALYAALGFIDPPEQEGSEASHFAHQSWSISSNNQVSFSGASQAILYCSVLSVQCQPGLCRIAMASIVKSRSRCFRVGHQPQQVKPFLQNRAEGWPACCCPALQAQRCMPWRQSASTQPSLPSRSAATAWSNPPSSAQVGPSATPS